MVLTYARMYTIYTRLYNGFRPWHFVATKSSHGEKRPPTPRCLRDRTLNQGFHFHHLGIALDGPKNKTFSQKTKVIWAELTRENPSFVKKSPKQLINATIRSDLRPSELLQVTLYLVRAVSINGSLLLQLPS